ncbi:D-alanine--D-alanine ligase [Thiogranum longum]|uniref:D-alanine--D-alanine ligase n=1 Tax=Thiogranum longum TaxID=1537524 RepID=A0A4R1HDG7_9GAMM|nr:D-alanine--D-alanine ligase [Thiogranum longum]TCK17319.1 D-alanine--D-alanine ligase [Thiogranum longum]
MNESISNPAVFGRVAVLMGGCSAEREVSLRSGKAVLGALLSKGIDAVAVDAGSPNFVPQLQAGAFDCAFNIVHGRGGEDGVLQGLLDYLDIPVTGSGVLGSALAMDKQRAKHVWQGLGLPTPDFNMLASEQDLESAAQRIGFPMMLKPVHEGSSIGMARVEKPEALERAWREADKYDHNVMAERWVSGEEYTTAIVGDVVLPLIRLETPREFYDYEAKYQSDSTQYHCPCGLPASRELELQQLSQRAFDAVGASGWGRVDLFLDEDEAPWLIEVNTVPGMTDHSLVPMAAKQHGWDMEELVWRILETALDGSKACGG